MGTDVRTPLNSGVKDGRIQQGKPRDAPPRAGWRTAGGGGGEIRCDQKQEGVMSDEGEVMQKRSDGYRII